jgi:hypothetical protein
MTDAVSGRHAQADNTWLMWGVGAVVAAVVADILFNINVGPGENGGTGPMIGVGIALVVVGALLYALAFPRIGNAAKGALIVGILAFLTLAAFWSAVPLLLAPAAYVLFRREPAATSARIGVGLAAVAAVVDVIAALSNL